MRRLRRGAGIAGAVVFALVMAVVLPARIAYASPEIEQLAEVEQLVTEYEEVLGMEEGLSFAPLSVVTGGGLVSGTVGTVDVAIAASPARSGFGTITHVAGAEVVLGLGTSASGVGAGQTIDVRVYAKTSPTESRILVTFSHAQDTARVIPVNYAALVTDTSIPEALDSAALAHASGAMYTATGRGSSAGVAYGWAWCETYSQPIWGHDGINRNATALTAYSATTADHLLKQHLGEPPLSRSAIAYMTHPAGSGGRVCPAWGTGALPWSTYDGAWSQRDRDTAAVERALDAAQRLADIAANRLEHESTREELGTLRAQVATGIATVKSDIAASELRIGQRLDGIESQLAGMGSDGWSSSQVDALLMVTQQMAGFAQGGNCDPRPPGWWTSLTFDPGRNPCAMTDEVYRQVQQKIAEAQELAEDARELRQRAEDAAAEAREVGRRAGEKAEAEARARELLEGVQEAVEGAKNGIVEGVVGLGDRIDSIVDGVSSKIDELIDAVREINDDSVDPGETPSSLPGMDQWLQLSTCVVVPVEGDMCQGPTIDLGFMVWEIFPCEQVQQLRPALGTLKTIIAALILVSAGALSARWLLAAFGLNAPRGEGP